MAAVRVGGGMPPRAPSLAGKGSAADKGKVLKERRSREGLRAEKADKSSTPVITAPLSELTKDMTHIPIKDMDAWVNRPIDVRRSEVARKNGKIARPMNSFMLYRSAYAERTKEWCAQNNHQVVSRASGQSWPLEPPEVREKFELLAIIERDNHQKAHPEYKFAPNKNQTSPKKKRVLDEDEASDANDPESDLQSTPRSRKRIKIGRSHESRDTTPFENQDLAQGHVYSQPPWQMENPGRPVPALSPPERTHYLQSTIHPNVMASHAEEMRYSKLALPEVQYHPTATLAGIPGSIHHDLLQTYSNATTPSQVDDSQVDPQLLTVDHGAGDPDEAYGVFGHCQYTLWQSENGNSVYLPVPSALTANSPHYVYGLSCYPMMQPMEDGHSIWDINHEEINTGAGKEFDQWLNAQPSGL
jgi:hypothetical protein